MAERIISFLVYSIPGLLFILLGSAIYLVQNDRQKRMTATVVGHVSRYSYWGQDNIAPVFSYTVDGKEYEVRRKFRSIVSKSVRTLPPAVRTGGAHLTDKDVLVLHTGNITDFDSMMAELWPIGNPATIFYDPRKPKRACAEKLRHLPSVISIIYFWLGGALMLAAIPMAIFL